MKLIYIGPHDGIVVPLPGGRFVRASRLGTIEVPANVGDSLLRQGSNWRKPPKAKPAKAKKAVTSGGNDTEGKDT